MESGNRLLGLDDSYEANNKLLKSEQFLDIICR